MNRGHRPSHDSLASSSSRASHSGALTSPSTSSQRIMAEVSATAAAAAAGTTATPPSTAIPGTTTAAIPPPHRLSHAGGPPLVRRSAASSSASPTTPSSLTTSAHRSGSGAAPPPAAPHRGTMRSDGGEALSLAPGAAAVSPAVPVAAAVTAASLEEMAARELQRQQTLHHANDLLTFCCIRNTHVTSIRQCTSSFFVLLYQRLFDCSIDGIDRSPNTAEKKRRNVALVLEELRRHRYSLDNIAAEEVVKLNEAHISRLIMVFVQIASEMQQHQDEAAAAAAATATTAIPTTTPAVSADHARGRTGVVGASGGGTGGGSYVPPGYTVAEVPTHGAAAPLDYGNRMDGGATPSGGGVGGAHFVRSGDFGHVEASFNAAEEEVEEEELPEEDQTSGSYSIDASAIPTDVLLEDWYRNLVYPVGPLADDSDIMRPNVDGSRREEQPQEARRHPPPQRHSSRHLVAAGNKATRGSRLGASDILQRCQRLDQTLDAQAKHNRPSLAKPVDLQASYHIDAARSSSRGGQEIPPSSRISNLGAMPVVHTQPRPPLRQLVAAPPLTQEERKLLGQLQSQPLRRIDGEQRDRKIQQLRAARYLGDTQQLIRQRMRREYDEQMSAMRHSLKESMQSARQEKQELMRHVRDENDRYRQAYAVLMEAAANELQVPARVMSRHTAQLADYYATSLQNTFNLSEQLKRETNRRNRDDVLRYAEEVSSWQQHFAM